MTVLVVSYYGPGTKGAEEALGNQGCFLRGDGVGTVTVGKEMGAVLC